MCSFPSATTSVEGTTSCSGPRPGGLFDFCPSSFPTTLPTSESCCHIPHPCCCPPVKSYHRLLSRVLSPRPTLAPTQVHYPPHCYISFQITSVPLVLLPQTPQWLSVELEFTPNLHPGLKGPGWPAPTTPLTSFPILSHLASFKKKKKDFIYLFILRERGREGGREGEKHERVVASPTRPAGT